MKTRYDLLSFIVFRYFAEGGCNMHGLGYDMVVPRAKNGETPKAQETW